MNRKYCYSCKEEKMLDAFYKNKSKKDGYADECKNCNIERSKLYQSRNKTKRKKYKDTYYKENQEKIIEYRKIYYKENKELVDNRNKSWAKTHKKEVTEIKNKYITNNKDRVLESKRCCTRKRRAKKQELRENYTKEDEQYTKKLFNNECVNCGSKEALSIDHHYPLSKGYVLNRKNAVLLCSRCNSSKQDKFPEEFYNEATLLKIVNLLVKNTK